MAGTLKVAQTNPRWKFTVQAVEAENGRFVAVMVAQGIPVAGLSPERARQVGRALIKAGQAIDDGNDDFPAWQGTL